MSSAAAALSTSLPDRGAPRAVSFKAPLLTQILDNADPERRDVVLDLGAPCQALVNLLSGTRRCRIEIADLVANNGLKALNGLTPDEDEDPGEAYRSAILDLLPEAGDEKLDLVFCWDLPNYLTPKVLLHLFDLIGQRAAPRCRLHMLIAYSKREMAAVPARYRPQADGQLMQISANSATCQAPRYSPEDLGFVVGNFGYERGVLLANGMQEFVYAWPDKPRANRRPY